MSDENLEPMQPEPQPEPMQPEPVKTENPYQAIIEQQNQQIGALIAQNESLTQQITTMIQRGAQLNPDNRQPEPEPEPESQQGQFELNKYYDDDDLSLDALGRMIGKK